MDLPRLTRFDFAHGSTVAHRPERSRMDRPEPVEGPWAKTRNAPVGALPGPTQSNAGGTLPRLGHHVHQGRFAALDDGDGAAEGRSEVFGIANRSFRKH